MATPLNDSVAIAHLGTGICSAYCTKLLIDGGATAIRIEPPEGDPLRRRSASGAATDPSTGGPVFQFLAASSESVVIDIGCAQDRALAWSVIEAADIVIWTPGSSIADAPEFSPRAIRARVPGVVVVAITDFGLIGLEHPRPATEYTMQAMAAGWVSKGQADRHPLMVGGDHACWGAGIFAALGAMAAWRRASASGEGELVDVSILDTLHITQPFFGATFEAAAGRPLRYVRSTILPLNHPTSDGYVGFQVTTGQQWLDFCAMIERPDWAEDRTLSRHDTRARRNAELVAVIDAWTSQRTTTEVVEYATLFRLPVAPINNGDTIRQFEQVVARNWVVKNPQGGFDQPAPPCIYWGDVTSRPAGIAPRLGEHNAAVATRHLPARTTAVRASDPKPLPLEGLRVMDFTAFWAGPIISHFLAIMGADVIHVESPKRPDGLRASTIKFDMSEGWWEASPQFAGTNTNKRDLTLDMSDARARELAVELIAQADILVENFSSRVMEQWGLTYERLQKINPKLIMVRASGFGNTGPWKDHLAYATTVEQACGMAWVTGFADGRPEMSGGSCDPIAGSHAALAILFALEYRRRSGKGLLLETPQFMTGLNICAEQMIEFSATGTLLSRNGNRSWTMAPQGAYRAADFEPPYEIMPKDDWIAVSVADDAQWRALCGVIGADALAADPDLANVQGRMRRHDEIDAAIAAWTRPLKAEDAVAMLLAAGVPAARFHPSAGLEHVPEVARRGLYEYVDQPGLGLVPIVGYPAQFEHGPHRIHRTPAPTFGQHSREILKGLLGVSDAVFESFEASGVVGTKPMMGTAW